MAPPLPNHLRKLIVHWRYVLRYTVIDISRLAQCCERTVHNILERHRRTGSPHVLPRGRRPRALNADDILFIISVIRFNPAIFLDEIQDRLGLRREVYVSLATISRTLHWLGHTNKHLSKQASQRNELLRATWQAANGHLPMHAMVWLDESGVDDRNMHRVDGWALEGMACPRSELFSRGVRTTILPAMTTDGYIAMHLFEGGVTKDHFVYFLQTQLVRSMFCPRPCISCSHIGTQAQSILPRESSSSQYRRTGQLRDPSRRGDCSHHRRGVWYVRSCPNSSVLMNSLQVRRSSTFPRTPPISTRSSSRSRSSRAGCGGTRLNTSPQRRSLGCCIKRQCPSRARTQQLGH
jgi:transposase